MMSLLLYRLPCTLLSLFRSRFRFRFRFLFPFPFLFRIPVSGFSRRPNNKRLYLVSYNVICVLFFSLLPLCCFVRHSSATPFSLHKNKINNSPCTLRSDYHDSKTEMKF